MSIILALARIGTIELSVVVTDGTGYVDFDAGTGVVSTVVISKVTAGEPTLSWVITDFKGYGVIGDGPSSGSEINFHVAERPCKGPNRFTIANASIDGEYKVMLYGSGLKGDWKY